MGPVVVRLAVGSLEPVLSELPMERPEQRRPEVAREKELVGTTGKDRYYPMVEQTQPELHRHQNPKDPRRPEQKRVLGQLWLWVSPTATRTCSIELVSSGLVC